MTKEERIQLRDELFEEFKKLKIIGLRDKKNNSNKYRIMNSNKINSILNNHIVIKRQYDLYINEFRSEKEALHCIINRDDYTNHLCPECNNICCMLKHPIKYNKTCGKSECIEKRANSKEAKEKSKLKCLNKYGKEHYSQTDQFKNQLKQTKFERYNNPNYNNRSKAKATCEERYGKSNPFQVEKFKEAGKRTNIKNIGVPYLMQSETQKEKWRQTYYKNHNLNRLININDIIRFLNKFNRIYNQNIQIQDLYSNNKYFVKFIKYLYKNKKRLLRIKEISDIFNLTPNSISYRIKNLNLLKYFYIQDSELEIQFKQFLEINNIKTKRKNRELRNNSNNNPFELDFVLKNNNIAFEINDIKSHNSIRKDKNYHINKTIKAKDNLNLRLIHLWEWELTNENLWARISNWILNLLNNSKIQVDIKDCEIKEANIKEAQDFLNKYNLYDYIEYDIALGLYYQDELLQMMTFKRQTNNEFKLLQFCTKFNYEINFSTKELLNYFIQHYNPQSITTTVNLDKFTGKTFEEIGFKLIQYKEPKLISYDNTSSLYKSIYNCGQNIYQLKN